MSREEIYNPLDKRHIGESVADAMLRKEREPLGSLEEFEGAGIYAIYYQGEFPAYQRMATGGGRVPIYVGKAVPAGARKGNVGIGVAAGKVLFNRLREHARSIEEAGNLDLDDFDCRFLVVEDIWIPLGESLLIARFSPIWNKIVDGFGNHDPGKGRYKQARSRWDVLHPGRAWAFKCAERPETSEQIADEVANQLALDPMLDDG